MAQRTNLLFIEMRVNYTSPDLHLRSLNKPLSLFLTNVTCSVMTLMSLMTEIHRHLATQDDRQIGIQLDKSIKMEHCLKKMRLFIELTDKEK